MDIELDCPWCSDTVRVARDDLEAEMRCERCGVRFGFAADERVVLAEAA